MKKIFILSFVLLIGCKTNQTTAPTTQTSSINGTYRGEYFYYKGTRSVGTAYDLQIQTTDNDTLYKGITGTAILYTDDFLTVYSRTPISGNLFDGRSYILNKHDTTLRIGDTLAMVGFWGDGSETFYAIKTYDTLRRTDVLGNNYYFIKQ